MTDPKPQQRPVRYMDFVSHKPRANADPLASRPASRPVAKPKLVTKVRSVADQIPAHQQTTAHPERAPKIETSKTTSVPIKKREEKPYISRTPATSRDFYADAIDPNKPIAKHPEKDDLAIKAAAALSGSAQPAVKSPDNNAYSLGGKSPFLENYVIDKRPLSDSIPAKPKDNFEKLSFLGVSEQEPSRHKNVYKKTKKPSDSPEKAEKSTKPQKSKTVKVIDDTKKKHGVPTWLVILITIILGAAVGAGVYFLLPK